MPLSPPFTSQGRGNLNPSWIVLLSMGLLLSAAAQGSSHGEPQPMRADPDQVRTWNRFVDDAYQLHLQQIKDHPVRTESRLGGYAAGSAGPEFYREVSYYEEDTGHLLSRIRWENGEVHSIHSIQVFVFDEDGRRSVEYLATYLPNFRNAPIQTIVNLHHEADTLRAFRQFDATGRRLYEQCRGTIDGESVWLEAEFFPVPDEVRGSELYGQCFARLDETPGERLAPLHATNQVRQWPAFVPASRAELDRLIERYDRQIPVTPLRGDLWVKRGDAHFLRGDFDKAVADYEAALEIDRALDEAWFGRGMARARQGKVREGIEDMNVYLERNPECSLGHTKRGIRYVWLGDTVRAEADFREALRIDPDNAEAHSDLGVLLAQRQDFDTAVRHMEAAVRNDPTYQKAFHNLAMVHYLQGRPAKAREAVDSALEINPYARDSLMLKGEILKVLGDEKTAREIQEAARTLPKRDWSERVPLD
jgi:tetratricopeptide (TPR) repeat protein